MYPSMEHRTNHPDTDYGFGILVNRYPYTFKG
jgi:hypothetical protein